jgi:hypothetical protein
MTDIYQLDLDEDFLSHLALPESIDILRAEKVKPELIEDDFVREVYQYVLKHIKEHKVVPSPSVLAEDFEVSFADPLTAIGDLVTRLRERYIKNNARQLMEGLKDAYTADPIGVPNYMVTEGRRFLQIVRPRGDAIGTGEFDRAMEIYDKRVLRGQGPSLAFKEIDNHNHGQTGITSVLGPPKGYKSWIGGIKIAYETIMSGGFAYLYSLELPPADTHARLLCMAADIPYWRHFKGALTAQDRKLLSKTEEMLTGMGSYQIVKPPAGDRGVEEMFSRAADEGADTIIFDQLQYVEAKSHMPLGMLDTKGYWQPLQTLRDLSDEVPVVVIHQFNREVQYADSMPDMQKAKNSAAIEETSSLVLGLWANKDMRKSGLIQLGMLASRYHDLVTWEIEIDLTRRCNFELLGIADDE